MEYLEIASIKILWFTSSLVSLLSRKHEQSVGVTFITIWCRIENLIFFVQVFYFRMEILYSQSCWGWRRKPSVLFATPFLCLPIAGWTAQTGFFSLPKQVAHPESNEWHEKALDGLTLFVIVVAFFAALFFSIEAI